MTDLSTKGPESGLFNHLLFPTSRKILSGPSFPKDFKGDITLMTLVNWLKEVTVFRVLTVNFLLLALVGCGLLPSRKDPNYSLIKKLNKKPVLLTSQEEKNELRAQWKREVAISEGMALGRYNVTAYPLTQGYVRSVDIDIPEKAQCFYVKLEIRSPHKKKAMLSSWEGVAKDYQERQYRLSWLPGSYSREPLQQHISGPSNNEKLWHQMGTLCTHGNLRFDRYFELELRVRKLSFPFYGSNAVYVWNVPETVLNEQGEEVEFQREEEVEAYRGW